MTQRLSPCPAKHSPTFPQGHPHCFASTLPFTCVRAVTASPPLHRPSSLQEQSAPPHLCWEAGSSTISIYFPPGPAWLPLYRVTQEPRFLCPSWSHDSLLRLLPLDDSSRATFEVIGMFPGSALFFVFPWVSAIRGRREGSETKGQRGDGRVVHARD